MNQCVQWDLPFWMWKWTFMSWSFMSVLASGSVSMIRSSVCRKQRGQIGKHRNYHNVHEEKALPSGLHHSQFSFQIQRISEDFLVCVFRPRKCGFSIGALFPTIIVVMMFWNFRVKFNWKLVFLVREPCQGNMRVFFQDSCFVILMWSWFVLNDGFGFAIGSNCIGRFSGTFVASLMWCQLHYKSQLIDVIRWSHGHCVSASMFRRGLTPIQWIGWDAVFRSCGYLGVKLFFWNSNLFIKIRNQAHVVPTDCFWRTGVLMTVTSV